MYGHVHLAKTAGTELNGELAIHYERVCGHKAYSYDAYSVNNVAEKNIGTPGKAIRLAAQNSGRGVNPGRVSKSIIEEIGYHDCDWISHEQRFEIWENVSIAIQPFQLELHVPCREPIEFLLSMANYKGTNFNCTHAKINLEQETRKHIIYTERYSGLLEQFQKNDTSRISMKCFNPIPIDPYLEHMGKILQPRRMQRSYIHRSMNKPRNKDMECLRHDDALAEKVRSLLVEKVNIFTFCNQCMGSQDDLLAEPQQVGS